jgi:tetratricopeptide (TPR) repeat protein
MLETNRNDAWPRSSWAKRASPLGWMATVAVVATLGTVMLLERRPNLPEAYRYPFTANLETRERTRTGAFAREIAFYQARAQRNAADGLDLAALAGAYLSRARVTGENAWYALAESAARRSLARLAVFNSGAHLALAEVAQARHDFSKALEIVSDVLKLEPHNGSAISLRASIRFALGELEVARRDADALVNALPNPSSLVLRAAILEAQGETTAAKRDFERALALENVDDAFSSARTRALFGRYWMRQGNTDLARGLLEESLRIAPNNPLATQHLARLEFTAANLERAERLYRSLRGSSGSPSTYDHVALVGLATIHAARSSSDADTLWEDAIGTLRLEVRQGAFSHRRDLASALLERGRDIDVEEALRNARLEAEVRRDADTLDVLRWAEKRCAEVRCER